MVTNQQFVIDPCSNIRNDKSDNVLLHQGDEWTVPWLTVPWYQEHLPWNDYYARLLEGKDLLNLWQLHNFEFGVENQLL